MCSVAQEDARSGWQLEAPLLLDAKERDAETCFEQEALQRQLVENQAGIPVFQNSSLIAMVACFALTVLRKLTDLSTSAGCVG